jgi:hypothetical protein
MRALALGVLAPVALRPTRPAEKRPYRFPDPDGTTREIEVTDEQAKTSRRAFMWTSPEVPDGELVETERAGPNQPDS